MDKSVAGISNGARRGAVGGGTALQTGRSRFRFPMSLILSVALWPWGRPPTEMNTRNISWGVKTVGAYG
jgi:hypothetical protein